MLASERRASRKGVHHKNEGNNLRTSGFADLGGSLSDQVAQALYQSIPPVKPNQPLCCGDLIPLVRDGNVVAADNEIIISPTWEQ